MSDVDTNGGKRRRNKRKCQVKATLAGGGSACS